MDPLPLESLCPVPGPLGSFLLSVAPKAGEGAIQPAIARGRRECNLWDRRGKACPWVLSGHSSGCSGVPQSSPFGNLGMALPEPP